AWVVCTATGPRFVGPPPALATAELMAEAEAAIAVNETVMFVLRPTASGPTLFQVNVPAPTVLGARLAETKPSWLDGKLSVTEMLVRVMLPLLMTCRLN